MAGTDPCGCASSGTEARNRPGQREISHRPGTYGSFLRAMHQALGRQPGLRALSTRDPSDPAIALVEAWAAVAEVLAFQGERIAQEGFLPTATTRDAVLVHARALGYDLRPGVAASTHLALSLDLPPDAPDEVLFPAGLAVQSVPGPDEEPQVFETAAPIMAVRGLDDLRPARVERVAPQAGDDEIVLAGTASGLRVGDRLLVLGAQRIATFTAGRWDLRRVAAVTPVEADPLDVESYGPAVPGHTLVRLESALTRVDPAADPGGPAVEVHVLRQGVPLFGHAAPPWAALPVSLRIGELEPGTWETVVPGAYAEREHSWVDASLPANAVRLELSRRVDELVADSWAVVAGGDETELLRVAGVTEEPLADFLLTSEASVLEVAGQQLDRFDRRSAVVWCASEPLQLGARPIAAPVAGATIVLDRIAAGLAPGRPLIVEGSRTIGGEPAVELATVHAVATVAAPGDGTATGITLTAPLAHTYQRDTVHLRANVVPATHGQRRDLVLGSGDGTAAFQRFVLPEGELTHIPPDLAANPTSTEVLRGAASSLELRVDGRRWRQVATLHGQPPDARVYTARVRAGDGRVEITFGDGVSGARLPTGRDNVTVAYRVGVGLVGHVRAEQLTLLMSRPLGLAGVRNPVPAAGAAEPEPLEAARRNAPAGVRTLGRVVSLTDVATLARTFGGIAKASAAWLWIGDERVVHVTVVPSDGSVLDAADPLLEAVADALNSARHPGPPIVVAPHRDVPVALRAGIVTDPDVVAGTVLAAAGLAVQDAFAAAARDLAQPLAAAEVVAVLHRVDGLVAVVPEHLHALSVAPRLDARVRARPATVDHGAVLAAELAWLATVDLAEVSA